MLLAAFGEDGATPPAVWTPRHEARIATILRKCALSLTFKMWRLLPATLPESDILLPRRSNCITVGQQGFRQGREQQTQHPPPARPTAAGDGRNTGGHRRDDVDRDGRGDVVARDHRRRGQSPRRGGDYPLLFS